MSFLRNLLGKKNTHAPAPTSDTATTPKSPITDRTAATAQVALGNNATIVDSDAEDYGMLGVLSKKQGKEIAMFMTKIGGRDLMLSLDALGITSPSAQAQVKEHLGGDLHGHQLLVMFTDFNVMGRAHNLIERKPYALRTRYTVIGARNNPEAFTCALEIGISMKGQMRRRFALTTVARSSLSQGAQDKFSSRLYA